jgi:predicted ATPase with chaperone activity
MEELKALIAKLEQDKTKAEELAKKYSFEVKALTAKIKKVERLIADFNDR